MSYNLRLSSFTSFYKIYGGVEVKLAKKTIKVLSDAFTNSKLLGFLNSLSNSKKGWVTIPTKTLLPDQDIMNSLVNEGVIASGFENGFIEASTFHNSVSVPNNLAPNLGKTDIKKILRNVHRKFPDETAVLKSDFEYLRKRVSSRTYSKLIEISLIKDILRVGYGITNVDSKGLKHRTTPSAGCFYPLLPYYLDFTSRDLYKFDGINLIKVKNQKISENLDYEDSIFRPKLVENIELEKATGVIIVCANIKDVCWKYGPRGYIFTLLESGHLLQNLCNAATVWGVGLCEIGWVDGKKVLDYVGLKKKSDIYILSAVVGGIN